LRDLLDVSVDGEVFLARVQPQAAPPYRLGQALRVMCGHQDIVLAVVETHLDPDDPVETKRSCSHEAQVIVYPTRGTLAHGFAGRAEEEGLSVRLFLAISKSAAFSSSIPSKAWGRSSGPSPLTTATPPMRSGTTAPRVIA
jgi:hypothetical protein